MKYNVYSDSRVFGNVDAKLYFDDFYNTKAILISKDIGSVDFNKVMGPANNKSDILMDINWVSGLWQRLSRREKNVEWLISNPSYYWSNFVKESMGFATFDNGKTFYIKAGNHQAYIAKLLFLLEEKVTGKSSHQLNLYLA